MASVTNIIEDIVSEIVDEPGEVEVKGTKVDRTTVIEISVDKNDIGKVIGKKGAMANALRVICNSIAGKRNERIIVTIIEE